MSADATEPPVPASLRRERTLAEIKEREFVHIGEVSRFGSRRRRCAGDVHSS